MFDNLTKRLSNILGNIRGSVYLTEDNIQKTLREIRITLLEADVALSVVHDFINRVKEKAIGYKVKKQLTPSQELIKIVHNELILTIGDNNKTLNLSVQPPAVVLIVGLHGSGKTTSLAKLGKFLYEKHKKKVLTVSTDVYRPAAIQQLKTLAHQVNVGFFCSNVNQSPVDIVYSALTEAKLQFYDVLLVDTAGCIHTNNKIMNEIKQISNAINPVETLFVIDVMTGQDAVNSASAFNTALSITGIILTKADCDTRGGVALSIRYITKKPIKFICSGEKPEAFEPFYSERMASRILGMGDVLSLIEDLENTINHEKTKKLALKLKKGSDFNLIDLQEQLNHIKNMGGIINLSQKLPMIGHIFNDTKNITDERILTKMEAIINSMTLKERVNPSIIKSSHKRRIASGCGMTVNDVNRFLKQFRTIQCIMKKMQTNKIQQIIKKALK